MQILNTQIIFLTNIIYRVVMFYKNYSKIVLKYIVIKYF